MLVFVIFVWINCGFIFIPIHSVFIILHALKQLIIIIDLYIYI